MRERFQCLLLRGYRARRVAMCQKQKRQTRHE
jgi:hypothetical protein